jgi:hypothetical protein
LTNGLKIIYLARLFVDFLVIYGRLVLTGKTARHGRGVFLLQGGQDVEVSIYLEPPVAGLAGTAVFSFEGPMDKKQLSERDICTKYITPAVTAAGWDNHWQISEEGGCYSKVATVQSQV